LINYNVKLNRYTIRMSVAQYIKQFKQDGINVLDDLSEDKYVILITKNE